MTITNPYHWRLRAPHWPGAAKLLRHDVPAIGCAISLGALLVLDVEPQVETARLIAVAITAGTLGILSRSTGPLPQADRAEVTDSQSLVKAALHRVNMALEDRLDQRTVLELIARSALEITSGSTCRLSLLDGPTLMVGKAGVYWQQADDDVASELRPGMAASPWESIDAKMTGLGEELGALEVWAGRNRRFTPAQEEALSYFASEVAAAVKNVVMLTETLSHASAVESNILEMSLWQRQLNEYRDDLARTHEELTQTQSVLEETYMATLEALAGAVDARDPYTYGHCKRVAGIASSLALQMGLPDLERGSLELAALLHDIGKIGVPDNVLRKVTPLSQEDAAAIHQHPEMGYRMLSALRFLGSGLAAVRYHHERFDGSGYPYALSGNQIPLLARILAVADAFDAITSDRPYRRARSRDQGVEEVRRCAGSQFDPSVVEAFVAFMNTAA